MMGPSISSDSALPATASDVLVKARETLTEENLRMGFLLITSILRNQIGDDVYPTHAYALDLPPTQLGFQSPPG